MPTLLPKGEMRVPDRCHTLGGVALHIAGVYARNPARCKAGLKYNLPAAIEKVCFRRQSIASCTTRVPSYIWCCPHVEDGDVVLGADLGHASQMVSTSNPQHYRISWPRDTVDNGGEWDLLGADMWPHRGGHVTWLLENGIALGQPILLLVQGWVTVSYEGEHDAGTDTELLYVDEGPRGEVQLVLPVWVDHQHWRK